jgi:hypothetical protein
MTWTTKSTPAVIGGSAIQGKNREAVRRLLDRFITFRGTTFVVSR